MPTTPLLFTVAQQARGFYEQLGFTAIGEVFNLDGVPHRRMQLQQ